MFSISSFLPRSLFLPPARSKRRSKKYNCDDQTLNVYTTAEKKSVCHLYCNDALVISYTVVVKSFFDSWIGNGE